ncbi:hypothetical protein IPMB12_06225 [Zophobihabitans entericus]|uniref:Uncharacterized protein n=2 Tax=Zophobihabitans entericus TaxID=1635327 RepID=A0A6G9IBV8_9GAMM|nr:hypothetical protein IPMB12_06225 [Zophobihabitans entericus]
MAKKEEEQKVYILEATRNYGGLIEIYRNRLQQNDTEETRIKLANLYYLTNNYESSMFYLKPIIEKTQSSQVFLLYGKNVMKTADGNQSDLIKAQGYVEKSLAIDPNNGEAYNVLGIIQVRLQQLDKAELSFNQARVLFYDETKVINNLAMISILQKNYRKSYAYLTQLYSKGNREPIVINNLFFTIVKLGDYNFAKSFCLEHKLSDFPDILINELKYVEPKEMVNHTFLAPNVIDVKIEHSNDLAEGSKIKGAEPAVQSTPVATTAMTKGATVAATPVTANDKTKASDTEVNNILQSMTLLPQSGETKAETTATTTTSTVKPVATTAAVVEGKNKVIDTRVGEHKDYTRLVIESANRDGYLLTKVSDQQYTITMNNIDIDSKMIDRLVSRIKTNNRDMVSVRVEQTAQNGIVIHLTTKGVVKVKESYLPPQSKYKHCFVFDFYNK